MSASKLDRDGSLHVIADLAIAIPTPEARLCLPVRKMDWQRLRERVAGVPRGFDWLQVCYAAAFGACPTALVGCLSLCWVPGAPSWQYTGLFWLGVAALAVGLILVFVHRKVTRVEAETVHGILKDMDVIEESFEAPVGEHGEVSGRGFVRYTSEGRGSRMTGPHDLTQANVSRLPQSPGAYILGVKPKQSIYIGRSDTNLRARMMRHLAENETDNCIRRYGVNIFWYQEAASAQQAYELELDWYNKYSHPCNDVPPARP